MTMLPLQHQPLSTSTGPLRRSATGRPVRQLARPGSSLQGSVPLAVARAEAGEGAGPGWSCWYTSSLALVSLAGLEDRPLGSQIRRHPCRVDARACIGHLLESAPAAGLSLFSRLDGQGPGARGLTFGPKPDITVVLQESASGRLQLPLAVVVRPQADGGCEICLPDVEQLQALPLPAELLGQAARLMRLVDRYWH